MAANSKKGAHAVARAAHAVARAAHAAAHAASRAAHAAARAAHAAARAAHASHASRAAASAAHADSAVRSAPANHLAAHWRKFAPHLELGQTARAHRMPKRTRCVSETEGNGTSRSVRRRVQPTFRP